MTYGIRYPVTVWVIRAHILCSCALATARSAYTTRLFFCVHMIGNKHLFWFSNHHQCRVALKRFRCVFRIVTLHGWMWSSTLKSELTRQGPAWGNFIKKSDGQTNSVRAWHWQKELPEAVPLAWKETKTFWQYPIFGFLFFFFKHFY